MALKLPLPTFSEPGGYSKMKAFWWFKDNSIAGMARPGFNAIHWCDLPFDEAVLFGWIGQFSSGSESLASFRKHLSDYVPKIYKFYRLDAESATQAISVFDEVTGLTSVFGRLAARTQILQSFEVTDGRIHFEMNERRLHAEIEFLKSQEISTVVSLTERHHSKGVLDGHFETHHFSIRDLDVPSADQVLHVADILKESRNGEKRVAVHCLAGIGRTSTMLISAHIALGENFEDLKELIARRNPAFALTGSQADFIHQISRQLGKGQLTLIDAPS